jgi:hypothetical protein
VISYWFILDLLAFLLITFRDDAKDFYKIIVYDLKNEFYIQWIFFMIMLLVYLPFTIPYSIIKLIKKRYE